MMGIALMLGMHTCYPSLACFNCSHCIGVRARQLRRSIRMQRNVTSMLFLFMCFIFIIYIIVSAALVVGQGLATYDQCNVATIVCLVCYIAIKGTV